jgi:acetate kinase
MILVLNAGSSSLKVAVFAPDLTEVARAVVAEIGSPRATLRCDGAETPLEASDHLAALQVVLAALTAKGLALSAITHAAHRVVHGGAKLTAPRRIGPMVLAAIEACIPLAPLHNPANLAGIRAMAALLPDIPQTASFDTAFHRTNPALATTYAIPQADRDRGIRRYGFHGTSYASLTARLPALTGLPLPQRLLAFHLGNGASLCAIRDGQSIATTMGYSPLDGLTMGTRAGGIDGNAVLDLARHHGIDAAARILNRESGLLALGGTSDMRALHAAGTPEAAFAIEHFTYWTLRHAGSMIAAMQGLDAIAFTGGIAEHDAFLRARILDGLAWAGARFDPAANAAHAPALHKPGTPVAIWIVPAREEAHIAAEGLALLGQGKAAG